MSGPLLTWFTFCSNFCGSLLFLSSKSNFTFFNLHIIALNSLLTQMSVVNFNLTKLDAHQVIYILFTQNTSYGYLSSYSLINNFNFYLFIMFDVGGLGFLNFLRAWVHMLETGSQYIHRSIQIYVNVILFQDNKKKEETFFPFYQHNND